MKRILFIAFIALLAVPALTAQDDGNTRVKYSNEFLNIGIGARAQAMGNSVIASTSDVYATYWNPAALAGFSSEQGLQIGAMHAEWFAGVAKFDYLGFTVPMSDGKRRIGLSLTRFGVDNIPNTIQLYDKDGTINYDNIFEFSAADYAFLGSYAQRMNTKKGNLYVGGNLKVIRRVIGTFANAWGFGLDLATNYQLESGWKFALVGRDITSTFNAWETTFTEQEKQVLIDTNNDLPSKNSTEITRPSLLVGIAKTFTFSNVTLLPELNAHITTDGQRNTLISGDPISIDPSFGMELGYDDFLFLRAGTNQFQYFTDFDNTETLTLRPSIGVGLKISNLQVDYAYTDLGSSNNSYSHIVSLSFDIKPQR